MWFVFNCMVSFQMITINSEVLTVKAGGVYRQPLLLGQFSKVLNGRLIAGQNLSFCNPDIYS